MPNRKYNFETLSRIVASSLSYAEVLRRLGLKQTGGSQANIKRLIEKFEIGTAHFLGQTRNQGERHRGGPEKAAVDQILVLRDPLAHPEKAYKLRRALIDMGIPYRCALCGMEAVWNGKPLMLTIDHINGHRYDNRRERISGFCARIAIVRLRHSVIVWA
jgi:transposase-like protein